MLDELISTPGTIQIATINRSGSLKKTIDLTPFSYDAGWIALDDEFPNNADRSPFADDVLFGGLDQDYFAISFGLQAQVPLPYGSKFTGSVSYLPSVSDFQNDFLIKSEAALLLPLYKQLSLKFSIADDYDNTPAPGTSFNYMTTLIGLSASL